MGRVAEFSPVVLAIGDSLLKVKYNHKATKTLWDARIPVFSVLQSLCP